MHTCTHAHARTHTHTHKHTHTHTHTHTAELNEQLHSPDVRQESTAPSLFKVQQMQRDIQELRTAVQQRDALIAELNARMQQDGQVTTTCVRALARTLPSASPSLPLSLSYKTGRAAACKQPSTLSLKG